MLRAAGFEFETCPTDVDERVRRGEAPAAYVRRLAAEKSAAAREKIALKGCAIPVILGADTAVVVAGEILGKPQNAAEAGAMLRRLSNRTHEVLTGVSIRWGAREIGRVESTAVQFGPLSDADVAWYVESGEGMDKAGGYAIQGLASRFVTRIDGSYSNVVGLPIAAVVELIREL